MKEIGTRICMTKDVGVGGNLFGGNMMSWADEYAAIHARRESREPWLVTKRIGAMDFKSPVKVGDMVVFAAYATKIGTTSIRFGIRAVNITTETEVFTTSFVFVAIDEDGKPKPIKVE
jgi:acyl-CoA thioesterase YciA